AGNKPGYQWKRNGQNIQGATSAAWRANTLNDNDEVRVEIISNYKCPQRTTATSNCIDVRILSSVEGNDELSGLTLYPNPNNGRFVLQGKIDGNQDVHIEIINALAQVVYKDNIEPVAGTLKANINIGNVPG